MQLGQLHRFFVAVFDLYFSEVLSEGGRSKGCQNDVGWLYDHNFLFVVDDVLEKLAYFLNRLDCIFHRHLEVEKKGTDWSEYL